MNPNPMTLSFSAALIYMKSGRPIARVGWNGAGQHVAMQTPDAHSKMGAPYAYLCNAQGKLVPWTPSQGDLFADDWVLV